MAEEKPEQPISEGPVVEAQEPTTQAGEEQDKAKKKAKGIIGAVLGTLEAVTGDEKRAKLILALVGVFVVIVLLMAIGSIFTGGPSRRPAGDGQLQPTPTISRGRPSPRPPLQQGEIDKFLEEIVEFDPNQPELQPPKVDLEIGL